MSQVKSNLSDLILNADGAGSDVVFQSNGVEVIKASEIAKANPPPAVGSSWDGDVYDDSAFWVGTNPSAKVYPDGSVVGVTDNGNYTRYPNGDLVCRYVSPTTLTTSLVGGQIFRTPTNNIYIYPATFIATPRTAPAPESMGGTGAWQAVYTGTASATSHEARSYSHANNSSIREGYVATGRWKT